MQTLCAGASDSAPFIPSPNREGILVCSTTHIIHPFITHGGKFIPQFMKKRKIRYALRAKRRSLGLTQEETAALLGLESPAHISRLEQGISDPSFATAFACAALFGAPLCELFPYITSDVRTQLKLRAQMLGMQCEDSTPHETHKTAFLDAVPSTAFHGGHMHYEV